MLAELDEDGPILLDCPQRPLCTPLVAGLEESGGFFGVIVMLFQRGPVTVMVSWATGLQGCGKMYSCIHTYRVLTTLPDLAAA